MLAIVGAFFATTLLFTQSAFAAGHSGPTKPGWGHGDKNHVHTGPPGHSVHPGHSVNTNSHVSISTTVNIMAAAGAKVVVNIVNNITQIFHIGA